MNDLAVWLDKAGRFCPSDASQKMDLLGLFQIGLVAHDWVHLVGKRLTKVFNYTAAGLLGEAKLAGSYRLMLLGLHDWALGAWRRHVA